MLQLAETWHVHPREVAGGDDLDWLIRGLYRAKVLAEAVPVKT